MEDFENNTFEGDSSMFSEDYRNLLEIKEVGRVVLDSEIFKEGCGQVHHGTSTVGRHTLEVTEEALHISDVLESHGIKIDREELIKGSLCHDLGIIGRHEKYLNNFVCWLAHPHDSVKIAKMLYPDMSKHLSRMISRHMWPATPLTPTSREGWILDLADTICAIRDVLPNHGKFSRFDYS